jgi:hypothetical protein
MLRVWFLSRLLEPHMIAHLSIAMPFTFKVERGSDIALRKFGGKIARTFKNEHVVPIAGIRIALGQGVINKHRQIQCVCDRQRHIEGWVLMCSDCGPCPVEHELSGGHAVSRGSWRRNALGKVWWKERLGSDHSGSDG